MTLAQWITETGRTQKWVAAQIGIRPERVNQIVKGHANWMSQKVALAIVKLTDGKVSLQEAIFPNGMPDEEGMR